MVGKLWTDRNRMVLVIILPLRDLTTRKQYRCYNFDQRIFMMTKYLLLIFLKTVMSDIQLDDGEIWKKRIHLYDIQDNGKICKSMIHWNYTTRTLKPYQKEGSYHKRLLVIGPSKKIRITVHESLGYWTQWQKFRYGAEVIHSRSCLPIFEGK